MYKYSKEHKFLRNERLQRSRTKNNLTRVGKYYDSNKILFHGKFIGWAIIEAPKGQNGLFEAESHLDYCRWLDDLCIQSVKNNVVVKFSKDVWLMAHTAVLLFAKIELILKKNNKRKITFNLNEANQQTKNLIVKSGIAKLINPSNSRAPSDFPILTGDCSDKNIQAWEDAVDLIVEHLTAGDTEAEFRIGSSLSEAVVNVNHHAYPDEECRNQRKWWLFFEIVDKNELFLVIYDAGVGIPATLPHKDWFREIVKIKPAILRAVQKPISMSDDASVIKASMIRGNTSTKKKKHGLGSGAILDLVESNSKGALWVCSNHGVYRKKSDCKKPHLINSKGSINGTLVQWNIRLRDE